MAKTKPAKPVKLSARKPVPAKPQLNKSANQSAARLGAKIGHPNAPALTEGFTSIIILAPGAEVTSAEAELRLRSVGRHHGLRHLPPVVRIAEIAPTPEATALALYRAFRAVGRGGPAIYLIDGNHVGGALTALRTDWGNTILCANDGTLALLQTLFDLRGITSHLAEIDTDRIVLAEQGRMQNPDWHPAPDFALRDILAPAAASLLAGTPLEKLTRAAGTRTRASGLAVHGSAFARGMSTLPLQIGASIPALAMRQDDGTWLLNLTLDDLSFDQMLDDQASFTLSHEHGCGWLRKLGLARKHKLVVHGHGHHEPESHKTHASCHHGGCCGSNKVPLNNCRNHLHLSPLQAPVWDERFLSVSLGDCCGHHGPVLAVTLVRTR